MQAIHLQVESAQTSEQSSQVSLRLPQSDQLSRTGGMLCGQDAHVIATVLRAGKTLN
ncbi:MAG: hypothetical protein HC765_10855 [Brachymonas sp.]|nr:hypothetical protein [Brachymonas sp.]